MYGMAELRRVCIPADDVGATSNERGRQQSGARIAKIAWFRTYRVVPRLVQGVVQG